MINIQMHMYDKKIHIKKVNTLHSHQNDWFDFCSTINTYLALQNILEFRGIATCVKSLVLVLTHSLQNQ